MRSVSSSFRVWRQQPVLLIRRHLIEARDLEIQRLEALDGLAVDARAIVEVLVEAEIRIEPGLLPFELSSVSASIHGLNRFNGSIGHAEDLRRARLTSANVAGDTTVSSV